MSRFGSNLLIILMAIFCLQQTPTADGYDDDKYDSRYYYKSDNVATKLRSIPDSISKAKNLIGKFGKYKSQVEIPITFKKGLYKAAEFDGGKTEPPPPPKKPAAVLKLPSKVSPVKRNETEAEKAERVHRTFEKLLTFVEIVGQVDNYVSTKWKNLVKTVSNLYEEEDEDKYRVHMKTIKNCPLLKD